MSRSIRVLASAIAFLILVLALVQVPGAPEPGRRGQADADAGTDASPTSAPIPMACARVCARRTTESRPSRHRRGGSTRSTRWPRASPDRPVSRSRSSSRSPAVAAGTIAGRTSRSRPRGPWPSVNWDDIDLFESTFDAFDAAGISVWLQVEPARCDVPMLIDLLYQQYGHHSERHRLRGRRRVVSKGPRQVRQARDRCRGAAPGWREPARDGVRTTCCSSSTG